jgi:hypothetical protein
MRQDLAGAARSSFRVTVITAYLADGGALEHAQEMAVHESPRTTKLYDRTKERLTKTRWKGLGGDLGFRWGGDERWPITPIRPLRSPTHRTTTSAP